MDDAIDTALALRLPTSDRMSFAEVQRRASSKSANEMITIGWGAEWGIF